MPIRYPIAFRGTARPSGCSAWRLEVPKIEHLTHPKPYIVPKTRCSSETFCLFLPYLLKPKPYIVPKTRSSSETFCLFQPYLLKAKPYIVPKTRSSSETFCLFQPYLLKPKPSLFVELGAVVHQRETSARFRHQRNLQAFFVTFCLFAFWRN